MSASGTVQEINLEKKINLEKMFSPTLNFISLNFNV